MSEQLIQELDKTYAIVIQTVGLQANGVPIQEFVPGYTSEDEAMRHVGQAIREGVFEFTLNNVRAVLMLGPGTKFMVMSQHNLQIAVANAKAAAMQAEAQQFQAQLSQREQAARGR